MFSLHYRAYWKHSDRCTDWAEFYTVRITIIAILIIIYRIWQTRKRDLSDTRIRGYTQIMHLPNIASPRAENNPHQFRHDTRG